MHPQAHAHTHLQLGEGGFSFVYLAKEAAVQAHSHQHNDAVSHQEYAIKKVCGPLSSTAVGRSDRTLEIDCLRCQLTSTALMRSCPFPRP